MSARTIALTGVSRGLGLELYRGLSAAGHRVIGCARTGSGPVAAVDVADDAQVARWAAGAIERHGPPDLLVNNAALINRPAPLWEVPAGELDALLRVNVGGTANAIRHFAPAMIAAGRGVIANFSSGWGRSVSPEVGPYCATKWAIEGLTRALAAELPAGLAAVAVNPGIIDTDMLRTCWGDAAAGFPDPATWAKAAVPFLLGLGPSDNGKSLDIGQHSGVFRQLFDGKSSTYTYLIADREAGEAVLIDPVFEQVQRDLALLRELDLRLRFTIDTHCHADHVTSAWLLKQLAGSEIVGSVNAGLSGADRLVDHGDKVELGDVALEVRATPGHTEGCLTFVDAAAGRAFTGDALLIRGAGRTDFQGGDAGRLYRSVKEQILSMPDDTALYPAHDYSGRMSTTVWEEKQFNPRLGGELCESDFVGFMTNLGLAHPKQIDIAVPANLRCGESEASIELLKTRPDWAPVVRTFAGVPEVEPAWVAGHPSDARVIDVRGADEYTGELGHIDGSDLVPLDTLRDALGEWERDAAYVMVCRAGGRSAQAARILEGAGFRRVANLAGGMIRWCSEGLPVVSAAAEG